ncbi:hypothetical protein AVEN_233560-1 [Araneus ventricosus]|uniref:Uncharacterized protein n=1 Tax=Araneus ventricosus TaxID=182803 RepID=A0A4Y2TQH4_ARAVE|nr:hypothetical protein AVEN_233560-1 [Araneus ventricosus]
MADSPQPPQLSSQSKDSVPFTASSTHACLQLHHWSSHHPLLLIGHGLEFTSTSLATEHLQLTALMERYVLHILSLQEVAPCGGRYSRQPNYEAFAFQCRFSGVVVALRS